MVTPGCGEALSWQALQEKFSRTKRSYFRFGLSFDPGFQRALLEQELSANAILYQHHDPLVAPHPENLARYSQQRFGQPLDFPDQPQTRLWRFTTRGVFSEDGQCHRLCHQGRNAGYRELDEWPGEHLGGAICQASDYLGRQVQGNGRYHYGWFSCFDRPIPTYNALRHASSTYALIESWELTRCPEQLAAIERALGYLTTRLIHSQPLPDGKMADFLVDEGQEVKLGGNALAILALAKYCELTGSTRYFSTLIRLARTVRFMQDPHSGAFVHVLRYPDLSLKAATRIIYYDGEAAFALMRLYGLTGQAEWLAVVEKAFDSFIAREHWRAHDHWLSYCVNELVAWRPLEKYFRFGLDNVRGHLDFVLARVTTYPTLLELMMAAHQMLIRLAASAHRHLLDDFDQPHFYRALNHRARYLMNGFFWPELAMFFSRPQRIVGSFFIRHHAWRVRIDDVEHYLSGYVAWLKYLRCQQHQPMQLKVPPPAQALFLCEELREVGNGIEVAMLRRAALFNTLDIPCAIVLSRWNPMLPAQLAALRQKQRLAAGVTVWCCYDSLLALRDRGELWPLASGQAVDFPLPAALTRRQHFAGERLVCEEFVDAFGQRLLSKHYRDRERLDYALWCDNTGQQHKIASEEALVAWLLRTGLDCQQHQHFIVDKNGPWRAWAGNRALRPANSTLSALIHSTHRHPDGELKSTYAHLLSEPASYDRLLVLTQEQRQDLLTEGVARQKMRLIPHPAAVIPAHLCHKPPGFQVLYMARYAAEKQHELLIRAFSRVVRQLPQARLVCHGHGPLRRQMVNLVARLGLTAHIAINGYSDDGAALQRASQCAVLCSTQEGCGLFGLESLSYGTPLISFAVKYGPRDLLAGHNGGVLVTANDEQALAQALVTFLSHPQHMPAMREAARLSTRRFAPEVIASRWQQWWQEVNGLLPIAAGQALL